jgi:hypothetical protein
MLERFEKKRSSDVRTIAMNNQGRQTDFNQTMTTDLGGYQMSPIKPTDYKRHS